jgi:hypothetical protein
MGNAGSRLVGVDLHLFEGEAPLLEIPELGCGEIAVEDAKTGDGEGFDFANDTGELGAGGDCYGENRVSCAPQPQSTKRRGHGAHQGVILEQRRIVLELDAGCV